MTVKKDSTTTSTSSSGASSAPPPQGHGIRAQIGSLIPKHALFQVHVHIDQLSNVPLIHGQFAVRWKFKNAQSGSGLLSKMKARRAFSGKGRGKALDDESGEEEEEDDSMHDDASRPVSPLSTRGHDDYGLDHPPRGPTPVVGMQRTSSQGNSESRGATRWAPLQSYNVKWDHSVSVVVQMDVHRETSDLLPNELKLVVMQVSLVLSTRVSIVFLVMFCPPRSAVLHPDPCISPWFFGAGATVAVELGRVALTWVIDGRSLCAVPSCSDVALSTRTYGASVLLGLRCRLNPGDQRMC